MPTMIATFGIVLLIFGGMSSERIHRSVVAIQGQQQPHQGPQEGQKRPPHKCRDRFGEWPEFTFWLQSCVMCHTFLFSHTRASQNQSRIFSLLQMRLDVAGPNATVMSARHSIARENLVFGDICAAIKMSDVNCDRWLTCCDAAQECCRKQISAANRNYSSTHAQCHSTWDGLRCWDATPADTVASQSCPHYMDHALPSRNAIKTCTKNATWFEKMTNNVSLPWTDYTPCVDKKAYLSSVYTCVAFNAISVAMLLPSIAIFLYYRDLLRQPRIRLHINFFFSLLLTSLVTGLWFITIQHEIIANSVYTDTAIFRNPVWCRIVAFFKFYLTSSTYFWMFCEGCYLHRLLSRAFEQPESLIGFYLFGWLAPILPTVIYCSIRSSIGNENCWAKNIGGYEWFIYAPNLLCLVFNLLSLCNILRILLFKLHSHPHEPSNFRRGLKAAIMLIPLFGLQMLLTIYRPDFSSAASGRHYEYISLAVSNSQGIFVSLIFCFLNGEVMSHFCGWYRTMSRHHSNQASHFTQVTMTDVRRSDTNNSLHGASVKSNGGKGFESNNHESISLQSIGGKKGALENNDY